MAVAGGGRGGWGVNGNIPEDWRLDKQSVDSGLDRAVDTYIPPTLVSGHWSGDCRWLVLKVNDLKFIPLNPIGG